MAEPRAETCPNCHGAAGFFVNQRWWSCLRCGGQGFVMRLAPSEQPAQGGDEDGDG